jgi:hypothetical protein
MITRVKFALGAAAILLGTAIENCAIAQQPGAYPTAMAAQPAAQGGVVAPAAGQCLYPRLNAPLYPSPVQGVPPWTGGAVITNQALAPHEMLYAHEYNALYPPFYYRVKGNWLFGAFGVKQSEVWKLEGTQVKVKYRSRPSLFSRLLFVPH